MVYRLSMIQGLALLLLVAAAAEGPAAEPAAPVAAQATTAAPTTPEASAGLPPPDLRMAAYDQFRAMYDTARYEEALPFAARVVELSENGADRDYELPIAYNNLGATQLKLNDYAAAEKSYRKSLDLLESSGGISSRRMVVPLAGLGAAYAAIDQHLLAVDQYQRALAVSRRSDGLFNLSQLPLIEQSAESRYAIEDFKGVESDRMYTLKVLEQNYGYADPRTLPAVLKLASFYEGLREYIAARLMYLRAHEISTKESGGYDPMTIKSLIGIARTHRMQYTMDPDTLESQQPTRDEITGEVVGKVYRESRVPPPAADRVGLKAADQALAMLRATGDPPRDLMTETLIELGDWYQSTSRPAVALPYYAEASGILAQNPDPALGNPLMVPRMVFYRPPVAASRGLNTLTGEYMIRTTLFNFTVSETGEPQDITVEKTNMSDGQLSQSRRALARANYSPRFVDGKAVATEKVSFTSEWYEEHNPESTTTPATTPATAPALNPGG